MEFNLYPGFLERARNCFDALYFRNWIMEGLELQLKDLDNELEYERHQLSEARTLARKVEALKRTYEIERKRTVMRHSLFEAQDMVEAEYKARIEQLSV